MKKFAALLVVASLLSIGCKEKKPEPVQTATEEAKTPGSDKVLEEHYRKLRIERIKENAHEAQHLYGAADELDTLHGASSATEKIYDLRLSEILAVTLSFVVSEPQEYNEEKELRENRNGDIPEVRRRARNHTREVMVAYGLFQTGNNPLGETLYKTVVSAIFLDKENRDMAYHWALPSIKKALAAMPKKDRDDYLRILRHTSGYMTTFSLAREREYLESLKQEQCYGNVVWKEKYYRLPSWMNTQDAYPCTGLFTIYGPDGKTNPYRKAEAFVYRRVRDGWKLVEMKRVLDRLITDLS